MFESPSYKIISNGIIAAIYFLLTFINPLGFGIIQVRIAEILCLLCFFRKDYIFGVTLGCILSNFTSTLGIWDVLIGGVATLISCLCLGYIKKRLWIGVILTILINTIFVGLEISYFLEMPLYLSFLGIFISETLSMVVGYLLLLILKNKNVLFKTLGANQNLDWKD